MRFREIALLSKAAVLGANVQSLQHILTPRLFSSYTREALFLHDSMFGRRLPAQSVYGLFPDKAEETITLNFAEKAWFGPIPTATADMVNLCLLARLLKPRVVFEIGTLAGSTALLFAINAPDAEVYTLDLASNELPALSTTVMDKEYVQMHKSAGALALNSHSASERIKRLCGDSAKFDYSPFHGRVDLFFIDGAHSYEYVKNDSLRALECCHAGSVIAWHDYGRHGVNGVSKWLHELSKTRHIYCIPGGSLAYTRVE